MSDILDDLYDSEQYPNDETELLKIPELEHDCPFLHDFMRFEFYKKEPCRTPELRFVVSQGQLWCSLSDPERERSTVRVAVKSLADGWLQMEGIISSGQIKQMWRYWSQFNGKKQRKTRGSTKRGSATSTSS